jgi:predicted phage terminase large subunit-like protein
MPQPTTTSTRTSPDPKLWYTQKRKQDALTSYWAFLDLIKYKGGTSKFSAIHRELTEFVEDKSNPRRLILMPRGHLKSTVCSVGYSLWRIYLNPNIRIFVGTATKPLAASFVREVKQYLEDQELQQHVWNARPHYQGRLVPILEAQGGRKPKSRRNADDDPFNFDEGYTEAEDKKIVWKGDSLQVLRDYILKEPTLHAGSVGAPNTGFHYDLGIFDDLVTFDNSDTPEKATRIIDWVADMESVIDPYNPDTDLGGESVMLGTRYAYKDLYGVYSLEDLTEEEREEEALFGESTGDEYVIFKRNIFVNGTDDTDGYLWPERFNAQVIASIKRRMLRLPNGLRRFASQYLNTIMSDEEVVLDPELIQYIAGPNVTAMKETGMVHIRMGGVEDTVKIKPYLVVDPAISQRKGADNTVIACGGLGENQALYVFDIKVGKFSPDEAIDYIYEMCEKWNITSVHIDNEKLGQALMHTIRSQFGRRQPLALFPYKPEGEKKGRITTFLEPRFKNNLVYLTSWMARLSVLMDEITFFPSARAHDDCLDAFAMLCHVAIPARDRTGTNNTTTRRRRQQHKRFNSIYGGVR